MSAGSVVWKLVGVGSGLGAAKVSRTVLDTVWAKTRGGEPPRNPAAPGTTWGEALAWAVASGVTVAIARLVVTRGAAALWESVTGALPPGLEEVGN
jgi:Protein of unknown function (DUF4235)